MPLRGQMYCSSRQLQGQRQKEAKETPPVIGEISSCVLQTPVPDAEQLLHCSCRCPEAWVTFETTLYFVV